MRWFANFNRPNPPAGLHGPIMMALPSLIGVIVLVLFAIAIFSGETP